MLAQYQSGAQTRRVRSLPDDGPFVELHPLLRWRMDRVGREGWGSMRRVAKRRQSAIADES